MSTENNDIEIETEETVEAEIKEIVEEEPSDDIDVGHFRRVIEAVMFAAGHPITYTTLAKVLESTPGVIKRIAREYSEEYNSDSEGIQRGVMMICFEDSCQLCTKESYGVEIREALGIKRGGNLSQSSIEALAVIAYNEPVTRAFIDTVRGVDSSYAISSLSEKNLIEACGRLDVPGRPILYRTTENFLRVFGINSLEELPEVALPSGNATVIQERIDFDEKNNEEE